MNTITEAENNVSAEETGTSTMILAAEECQKKRGRKDDHIYDTPIFSCESCELVCKDMDELQNHRVNSCSQNKLADQTTIESSDCFPDDDENEGADDVSTSHEPTEAAKVLAGLIVEAPSTEVRDCLRQYSENKSYKKQSIAFIVYGKQVIIQALTFLGATHKNWDDHIKSACIHELIYRIQGLLPEVCAICNDTYTIHKDDSPLLACSICKQEVHRECYTPLLNGNQNIADLPGFHYFCPSCEKDLIPEKDTGLKKGKKKEIANISILDNLDDSTEKHPKHVRFHPNIPNVSDSIVKDDGKKKAQNSLELSENSADKIQSFSHTKATPPLRPNVKVADKFEHQPDGKKNDQMDESNVTKSSICNRYRNNACEHGLKGKGCKFLHPKRCSKLMNHGTKTGKGCNLGKKCADFHPKMCPSSIAKSVCYDEKCTLCHVKGTKRKLPQQDRLNHREKAEVTTDNQSESYTKKPDNAPSKNEDQSFLMHINLLRKEIQEVVDSKISSLLQVPHRLNLLTHPMSHPPLMQSHQAHHQMPQVVPYHPMWSPYPQSQFVPVQQVQQQRMQTYL